MSNYNLNAILSVTNNFTQPLKQFKEQMSNILKTTRETTSNINKNVKDGTKGIKDNVDNTTSQIRSKINEINKSNASLKSKVLQIAAEYRKLGKNASEAMKLAWKEVDHTNNSTKKLISDFKVLDSVAGKFKGLDSLAGKLKTVALSMGAFGGFKSMFDSASSMEGYRNTLNVVMKDTELAGKKIKEAIEFANSTPFETDEIVAGMVKLESYGIDSSNEVMTMVGDMAGVMGKSFDQAVEAVADAQTGELERLKEFGITKNMIVEHAEKTMAGIEIVNAKGQIVNQEKFNEAMFSLMKERYAGGMELQAKTAKGVLSTTAGMIGNIMAILGGVDEYGYVIEGGLLDTVKNVVEKINNKLKELSDNGTIKKIQEKINNAIAFVKNVVKAVIAKIKELNDNGTLKRWGDNIAKVINIVKNVINIIIAKIKELNDNGTLQRWGQNILKVVNIVKKIAIAFIKNRDIIIPIIAGIVSAFGAFKSINKVIKIVQKIRQAFTRLKAVFAILTSPIGLVAIAIGLVVAAFIYAYTHSETFRNKVNAVIEIVKEKVGTLVEKVKGCFENIKAFLDAHQEQINKVKEFIGKIIEGVIDTFGNLITDIGTMLSGSIDVITGIIDIISGIFEGDWNKVWEGFKTTVDGAIKVVTGWWNGLKDLFEKPINFVINLFKKDQSETATVESEEVGENAKGTRNWRGGWTWVNEEGGELMNLPNGTQIIPHDLSEVMVKEHARNAGNGMTVNIPKLADTIVVREDADIDKIGEALANKLNIARMRFA